MVATLGDLTQIPVTTRPTQGLPQLGDVGVTLYNQDLTNLVYISYQQWFAPGAGNCVPIQPLTSITISAKRAIYVASLVSGVSPLMVLPEGSQAQPSPAQIAAQINALGLAKDTTLAAQTSGGGTIAANIAASGAPLLTGFTQALNVTAGTVVNAGVTTTFPGAGTIAVTQIGYEIALSIESTAATCVTQLVINWLDQNGNPLSTEIHWMYAGTTGNPHTLYGEGPTDGTQFTIQIQSFTGNTKINQLTVWQNSRVYNNPAMLYSRNVPALANGGVSLANIGMKYKVIGQRALINQGIGATDNTTIGLYGGYVCIYGHTSSNTTDMRLIITTQSNQDASGGQEVFGKNTDSAGDINSGPILMPRIQCQASITNNNAATKNTRYQIVAL